MGIDMSGLIGMPFTSLRQLMRRGSARLLVLKAVSLHPMHGYEVTKEISSMFEGTYVPRSGVIYPTLQWLEDNGFVVGSRLGDRTVYTITGSGKKHLRQNEVVINDIVTYIQKKSEGQDFSILRSATRLQKTIMVGLPGMSEQDKKKVAKILDGANADVSKLMLYESRLRRMKK